MLVQCPGCRTTYRVSEEAVATPKPTFRCSRCKNIFDLGAKSAAKAPRDNSEAPSEASLDSQELSFSFPATKTLAEEKREEIISELPAPAVAENGPAPRENEASPPDGEREEEWSLFKDSSAEEDFTLRSEKTPPRFSQPDEAPFVFARERQNATDENPERGAPAQRPLSVTPFLLLCGILLFSCASLTLLYKARPEIIEPVLKSLPLLGPSISRNDYLRQGIVLQTSLTRFQRIQGNREVFLLSGAAVNRNRVRVREVKIEGFIFARDGTVIESRVITIGNAISPKIIRDLTQQEILDLQKQGPVKRFEIPPDESAPFSIVFFKTNAGAQSFGYRVLSAEEA